MRDALFQTAITKLLNIRHPLLCGGMGPGLSDARYVAAVVNAGGMGFIVTTSHDKQGGFEAQLDLCRTLTEGKGFGVNLYISHQVGGLERAQAILALLPRYGVSCVEIAGANPARIVPQLKDMGIKVLHKVPAIRYVASAERAGADAVIVVGQECGGHPGVYMVGSLVQSAQAPHATSLPTVAAGGYGTGGQLVGALAMGNGAILMGSRMLVSEELWISRRYKDFIATATGTESVVVKSLLRDQHRVYHNESARAVLEIEAQGITDFEAYRPHVTGTLSYAAYESGDPSKGMLDFGHAVGFANDIKPVDAIFDDILDQAKAVLGQISALAPSSTTD